MPSKPHKAPPKFAATIKAELYQESDEALALAFADDDGRATVARILITGPDGESASAFLSVACRDGRWSAEISHDATDYNTDTISWRRKAVSLRFFGKRS